MHSQTKNVPCDFLSQTVWRGDVGRKAVRNIRIQISGTGEVFTRLDAIEVCPVAFEIYERLEKRIWVEVQAR